MIGKPWRRFLKLTKMLHAGLLHVSLLLRVARDLGLWLSLQHWGGLLNTLAVLLFLINNVRVLKLGEPAAAQGASGKVPSATTVTLRGGVSPNAALTDRAFTFRALAFFFWMNGNHRAGSRADDLFGNAA